MREVTRASIESDPRYGGYGSAPRTVKPAIVHKPAYTTIVGADIDLTAWPGVCVTGGEAREMAKMATAEGVGIVVLPSESRTRSIVYVLTHDAELFAKITGDV